MKAGGTFRILVDGYVLLYSVHVLLQVKAGGAFRVLGDGYVLCYILSFCCYR